MSINLTGTPAAGTYTAINYAGTALTTAQFGLFRPGTAPAGKVIGLVNNTANTSLDIAVQTAGTTNTWTGGTSNTWDTTTANNWSGGASRPASKSYSPMARPTAPSPAVRSLRRR